MPPLVDCHPWLNSGLLPHPTVGARSNIGVDVLRVSEFGLGTSGFVLLYICICCVYGVSDEHVCLGDFEGCW